MVKLVYGGGGGWEGAGGDTCRVDLYSLNVLDFDLGRTCSWMRG